MPINHFPCRLCGQTTLGHDSYVVCQECVDDFADDAALADDRLGQGGHAASMQAPTPLSPDEQDARLRRLLDDW